MMTIRQYICGSKKTIPRGAVSRVAEYLDTGREQAIEVITGMSRDMDLIRRGQDFVASRASFAPLKTGRESRVNAEKLVALFDAGKSLREIGETIGISRETVRKIARKHGRKMRGVKNNSRRKCLISPRTTRKAKD